MPREAPVAKVAAVQAFGGTVELGGDTVDDCVAAALERAAETGAGFVHPFDHPDVILGQATLGLELLEDVPELQTVIVPVGGGGLISGIAGVVKTARPDVRVIGIQVDACAPFPESLARGEPLMCTPKAATIADGIAVKRPGKLTLALVERWVDELIVVDEDETADAMVWLIERAKLVVEGGGAVGVAALLSGKVSAGATGTTAIALSGGNVDAPLLAAIAQRGETTAWPTGRGCSRGSATYLGVWRRCSPRSRTRAATSCRPTTSVKRCHCTSGRRRSRSRWRPAAPSTATRSSPPSSQTATRSTDS